MKYIIFVVLVLIVIGCVLFYENKLSYSKRQLIVLTRQVDDLRTKVSSSSKRRDSKLLVKYLIPTNRMGLTNTNSNLFIAPLDDSPILQKLSVKMEVSILDKVDINTEAWFYVEIPSDNNINCRGWVKQKDFSLFYDSSRAISRTY